MITAITKPRDFRQFLTYDLEWVPGTLEVRLVGVYDGKRYRHYRSVHEFVMNELTSKNRGKWFYAHAGGLADFQFLLEYLTDQGGFEYDSDGNLVKQSGHGYTVEGSFSGSSAIIVHVTKGKNVWHFIDSYWLMRDKLRNIGKWVGIEKGNTDECPIFYENAPLTELLHYNYLDCLILWKAVDLFESILIELGGMLKMTQASCAMELFRRRFLKKDIHTSSSVNEISREAYFASRVEVFMREAFDSYYYDVNSSFPFSMTHTVPGELIGSFSKRLPDSDNPYLAECTVEVPDMYMPPLPVRHRGRLFFPTGTWKGWYSNIDIELLERVGGRIAQVHESMEFEKCDDLKDYAETLYGLRKNSEGFPKLAYKYLLNSLYGKFAESSEKSGFVINPMEVKEGWNMLFPGAFLYEQTVSIPHMHVPMSVHITSIARRTLYDYMAESSQVHYCDTDGFSSKNQIHRNVGNELGQIKLEKTLRRGLFVQAKVYMLDGTTVDGKELLQRKTEKCSYCGGSHDESVEGVKAKGFSRMSPEKFEALLEDRDVEYTRMKRIKENLRLGVLKPREDIIRKRLRHPVAKRSFFKNGQSRPWTYEELEELK